MMTFEEAYQKLEEAFPNQYCTLTYTKNPYKSYLKGYVETKGWSDECSSMEEIIVRLNGKEVIPAVFGPEVK